MPTPAARPKKTASSRAAASKALGRGMRADCTSPGRDRFRPWAMGSPNRLLWLPDTHLFAWLRRRQATENWFLLLVPVTGLVTGLAAVLLIRLTQIVQK